MSSSPPTRRSSATAISTGVWYRPHGSSVRLPGAVGRGLSRWLLLTGELLPATAFENTGWIRAIVPEADLEATATRICHQLADRHRPAQQRLKTLLHRIDGMPPEQALREELATFADNW